MKNQLVLWVITVLAGLAYAALLAFTFTNGARP